MQFRDLKTQYKINKDNIDNAIQQVLDEGNYIMGRQVFELEKILADYVGVKHCITCANGTDALTLALMAYDIKENDAVFIPDFTFFATGEVICFQGATPIFVDIDKETFNICPNRLEESIKIVVEDKKLNPKAIIAVDLFGLPANYEKLEKIAQKYNLILIEDAAQGFGGSINGKRAGSFGNIATTSFFPAKPLGCYGDGGAIFTDNDEIAELIKSYRIHGKGSHKYDNIRVGMNSRLDTIQAAILLEKFRVFVNFELGKVNDIANYYNSELGMLFKTPSIENSYYSSWAQYTIVSNNKEERERIREHLSNNNIPTMIYYPKPMSKQDAFKDTISVDIQNSITEDICKKVLSLPIHPYMTKEEVVKICEIIKSII